MQIDKATIEALELGRVALLRTITPSGARVLQHNLLRPEIDIHAITSRQDAVEELSTNETVVLAIKGALKATLDADKIVARMTVVPSHQSITQTEQAINNVILLRELIQMAEDIHTPLSEASCDLLQTIASICSPENLESIKNLISNVINEDTAYAKRPLDMRNQRTYAVKSGINGLLDVARQTYKESTDDALMHMEEVIKEYGLPLRIKYDTRRQFFMQIATGELPSQELPSTFINIYQRKDIIECQTLELVKRNQKMLDAHTEVLLMSDHIIHELIMHTQIHIPLMLKVSESIAEIDLLVSFAQLATTRGYVRPIFSDTLAIRAARHPVRESIQGSKFVPNDIYATQQTRFQIVTGCNMSGKSTYIRTVALLSILAQIGSFVPADYASMPIIHHIFARVSTDDNATANLSSFAAEMAETAHILRNVGPNSMVIIDELGRGTSTRDGLAIALAIAEALISSRAFVWFATHFRDLASILSERAGVVSLHLQVSMPTVDRLEMLYKIASGTAQEKHYGLRLANVVRLPQDVLDHAEHVAATIEQTAERKKRPACLITARRRRLIMNLKEHLVQAKESKMDQADLREWLMELQEEFVANMTALEERKGDSDPSARAD